MPGKHAKSQQRTIYLHAFDQRAQLVLEHLDGMRDHQRKCPKCKHLPSVRAEAKPCGEMTRLAVWLSAFWAEFDRRTPGEQQMFEGLVPTDQGV